MLEGVKESGERAASIVSDMLTFSRRSDSKNQPVNLKDILERTIDMAGKDYDLKKKYDFRHIEIIREYGTEDHVIDCIETEIEQVVLNLLRNAAQAMTNNSEQTPPRIILRTSCENKTMRIEIEDNGSGMDEETRMRVFEPFFTTKPVGIGTGLGLSVSHMIITKNHQGFIEVESEKEKGTKFTLRLPF